MFKLAAKNGRIDYVATNLEQPTCSQIRSAIKARWSVEVFHRELKQTCGIEPLSGPPLAEHSAIIFALLSRLGSTDTFV